MLSVYNNVYSTCTYCLAYLQSMITAYPVICFYYGRKLLFIQKTCLLSAMSLVVLPEGQNSDQYSVTPG